MAQEIISNSIFDDDTAVEAAYWETNKHRLIAEHPDKYLIIRGKEVVHILATAEEVFDVMQTEDAQPSDIVCNTFTSRSPAVMPLSIVA